MVTETKDQVLVVVQLSGGNDFMNTVVPYGNELYYDFRKALAIPESDILPINNEIGFPQFARPFHEEYMNGNMAIVQGVGYPDSTRSHFRSMDIWHTCVPETIADEGWLGQTIRNIDPNKENPLTAVSIGQGLPRALSAKNVTVTSVADLDSYGLMTDLEVEATRAQALQSFKDIYGQAIGSGVVKDYIANTGLDLLRGADQLKQAPASYKSDVEYAANPIAKSLRDIARIHLAGLGTRVFYAQHGGYDTHANEGPVHPGLIGDLSGAVSDFFADLRAHNAADNVTMLIFTEFGRRVRSNGSGTDHGAGGGAYIIGDNVKGGLYADYPSLDPENHDNGDLAFTYDFRGLYSTLLEQVLKVEAKPIVGGGYEQLGVFS